MPWKFSLYWIYFLHSGFLSNLRLLWKTECVLKFFTVLNILFTFKIFEQLALALKNSVPWNFSLYWISFYIQEFWATCASLKKTELALKFFTILNILFTFRIFEQLALALKNRVCPENFHCIEYTFYIQDFWATCACPERQSVLKFFIVLNILFTFRIFEQLALALKNRVCPEIFHCMETFFYHSGFWATCACPENRISPEIFQAGGRLPSPRPPAYAGEVFMLAPTFFLGLAMPALFFILESPL